MKLFLSLYSSLVRIIYSLREYSFFFITVKIFANIKLTSVLGTTDIGPSIQALIVLRLELASLATLSFSGKLADCNITDGRVSTLLQFESFKAMIAAESLKSGGKILPVSNTTLFHDCGGNKLCTDFFLIGIVRTKLQGKKFLRK